MFRIRSETWWHYERQYLRWSQAWQYFCEHKPSLSRWFEITPPQRSSSKISKIAYKSGLSHWVIPDPVDESKRVVVFATSPKEEGGDCTLVIDDIPMTNTGNADNPVYVVNSKRRLTNPSKRDSATFPRHPACVFPIYKTNVAKRLAFYLTGPIQLWHDEV